jgi:hypothetical protein
MALTKETVNDKIEVISKGDWSVVQVRTATIISEDGVELSRSYHRHVVMPDADIAQEDLNVYAVANVTFTDAVKAAYQTHLAAQAV